MTQNNLATIDNQEIPEGYKKTEVGLIPQDWSVQKFGGLFEPSITRMKLKSDDSVAFVGMQDVSESAQLITQKVVKFHEVKSGFTFFGKGDVLVAKITPCFENGKGCITDNLITNIGYGSTEFHVLRANQNSVSKFIYYWTVNSTFRKKLELDMVGSAGHRRVPVSSIQNYLIPLPATHVEQQKIATALSDTDALISKLEKLIEKKQAIKTATMQQLLTGKTRLPEFALREDGTPKGYKDSELSQIPEDWMALSIGSDTSLKARIGWQALTTAEYLKEGNYYLVTGTDFNGGLVNWNSCCYVSEWRYKQDKNIQLQEYDVLVTKDGTIGKVGFIESLPLPATLNSGVFVVRPKLTKCLPGFLFYILTSSYFDDFVKLITAGSTIVHLYQKDFVNFKFYVPHNIEEQSAIANILADLDAELAKLNLKLDKFKNIKQGMMQELLTGKTRLV